MVYKKYYLYKKQVSYDQGETWEDVTPAEYIPSGDPIGTYDTLEECMTVYRTIQSGYTCVGYDKHNQDVYEVSYDNGVTWSVVSTSAGTLISADSPDCGYIPPFNGKFKLTLSDSSTISAECDSTSSVTSGEVSTQYSGNVVSAVIGNCVTSIGHNAFHRCYSLTSVTILDSVKTIDYGAFNKCTSLSSITIPDSVETIKRWVFEDCHSLSTIKIPSSVTNIGDTAFVNCRSLTSITVDSNNSVYDSRNNCNAIIETSTNTLKFGCNNTIIPNTVTSIYITAFGGCGITNIVIPDSVTNIGEGAFQGCSGLTSITVEATTPPALGSRAFNDSICSIYVPAASVNTYKNASGWNSYSSRITAIL